MPTTTKLFGCLYLGNKMSGVPYFNAPWFDESAAWLRQVPGVGFVFNPADEDRDRGFEPMLCPNGTADEAAAAGFVLRDALAADWNWIAEFSEGLVIGSDWAKSPGTISEIACHQALKLPVWEYGVIRFHQLHNTLYALSQPDWQFPALSKYLI